MDAKPLRFAGRKLEDPFVKLILLLAWIATAQAQPIAIHMSAGMAPFTDTQGTNWTPNTCSGFVNFSNPGTFPNPIYNTTAYTQTAGTPIVCQFPGIAGTYEILVHLIEAVKSFNAPQKRVFNILVNGNPALTNIDIYQRAGGVEIPYDVVTYASTTPTGGIVVSFSQVKSSAMFAGIELLPISQPGLNVLDANSQQIGIASSYGVAEGVGVVCLPSVSSSGILFVTCSLDTNVALLKSDLQGPLNPQICTSTSGSGSAYTASCSKSLNGPLATPTVLYWFCDIANTGSETLTVDGSPSAVTPAPLLDPNGKPLAVGMLSARLYVIWFDGAAWRVMIDLAQIPAVANVQRWQCCAGLQMLKLTLADGTTRGPYAGPVANPIEASNGNWVSIPVTAPDQD